VRVEEIAMLVNRRALDEVVNFGTMY
jgi:hypothetical protein